MVACRIVLIAVTVPPIFSAFARSASAQEAPFDRFDGARGATISFASPTEDSFGAGFLIDDKFGINRVTIFRDASGPAGTVDVARIKVFPDRPAVVTGVTLYTLSDGGIEDGNRGVSNFRLLADLGSGTPDLVLIDGVNPRDDGSPNTYTFPPIELWAVDAFFTRSSDAGPRVVELNSIDGPDVPEPGSAAAVLLGCAFLALRRRRR